MLHLKMWWDIAAVVVVIWFLGLTHARLEMWMKPEDKNVYYVEEGGSISLQCNVIIDLGVTVNLTWSGPSIDASKPQRVSNIPHENYERVGNWLNITHFSNTTAGYYKCRALTSASPPNDLTQTIRLVKGCDVGKFNPPSCKESCSQYCKPVPEGAKGRNCDNIGGRCLYGCREGHAGLKCTECDNDRFNHPSCNKNCSTYCNPGPYEAKGRKCNQINGTCLSGCQEGYKMPNCIEKSDDLCDKILGGLIGGVIGLIVVVIIVLLLVRHVKKRRKESQREEDNEARTKLLRKKKPTDLENKTMRDEMGKHMQEKERLLNLRVSQVLEHKIIEVEYEEKRQLAAKLEKVNKEKEKLQQKIDENIKQKELLETKLKLERSTNEIAVLQGQVDRIQNRVKQLEEEKKTVASEENNVREKHEYKSSEIDNRVKRLMRNQSLVHQDLMEDRRDINSSSCSVYDEEISKKIRTVFIDRIIPQDVLHLFHKYNPSILTQRDIEYISEVTNIRGEFDGAAELLTFLVRYKDWFPCLLLVLRDPCVKQESVANEMEGLLEQDRNSQNPVSDADTTIVTDENKKGDDAIALCEEQAKLNTSQDETQPFTGFKAETRCALPHITPIENYSTVETNYGGHFNPKKGVYTVPQNGRYHVTFSTDHQESELFLRRERHTRLSLHRSHERDISGPKRPPFDESKGVREITCKCKLGKRDSIYLLGSPSSSKVDATVKFSVSYINN